MRSPLFFALTLLFFLLPFSAGCATILRGTTDTIHVSVEYYLPELLTPADISLDAGGRRIPAGGGPVQVARSPNPLSIHALCKKPGYTVTVQPSAVAPSYSAGWVIVDLLFFPFGIFGLDMDKKSGVFWNYPDDIDITVIAKPERKSEP